MESQPLVSVITNSYNARRFLRTNVESMLKQDYERWEHIVVDCGSNDGSVDLLASLAHPRLRLLQVPFCGVSKARLLGIGESHGELVAILDADDWGTPDRIGRQVRFLGDHPEVVCCSTGIVRFNEGTGEERTFLYPTGHDAIVRLLTAVFNVCPHSSLMYRRSAYDVARGYSSDFEKAEDFEFLLRLARVGRLASIDRPLVTCTEHPDSHTHMHKPKGRDVTYYAVLGVILHALDGQPNATAPTLDAVTSWLDSVGPTGIRALCGRWVLGAFAAASRELDLRSLRYLGRGVAYYSVPMLRHRRDSWWHDAASPQRLAAKLTQAEGRVKDKASPRNQIPGGTEVERS